MVALIVGIAALMLTVAVNADMYMHNPRGSNNRQEETSRERKNANRLFDSQNNNRGGYNSGAGGMYYYAGSKLPIQWTNQHSCGDPNNNCEIIIQYMCSNDLRDGTVTSTIRDSKQSHTEKRYGMHEDYNYYQNCKNRERNKGLFTADQKLKGSTAKYTRQNAAGTRRGFECPEERDYYPYWQPSPWKDIAILTNDVSRCSYYKRESQNVKPRSACVLSESSGSGGGGSSSRSRSRNRRRRRRRGKGKREKRAKTKEIPITKEACEQITGATWKEFAAPANPVDCRKAPWSRDNHHGNGVGGYMNVYEWTVPDIEASNCALRIRYNISTNDFDTWNTFSDKNGDNPTKVDISNLVGLSSSEASSRGYVYKNNPEVQVLSKSSKFKLQLAMNTAQYGRTFQDRSHKFEIRKRPTELQNQKIHNVNVRGKRGNIVQVYPGVEYDFVPNKLEIANGDYVHFQWTGSDKNPRNNAGQGKAGTDRSNVVLLASQIYSEGRKKSSSTHGHFGRNYPENINNDGILGYSKADLTQLAILKQGSGRELDNASPYFDMGARKVTSAGTFFYMCTRNNNFSNRSQKGKIVVQNGRSGKKDEIAMIEDSADGQWAKSVTLENSMSSKHQPIAVEELSKDEGEQLLTANGGAMNEDDGYASKYIAVYPMEKFKDEDSKLTIDLKVNDTYKPDDVTVYRTTDMKRWEELDNQDIKAGNAKIKLDQGGLYVARYSDNSMDTLDDEEDEEVEIEDNSNDKDDNSDNIISIDQ